MQKNTAKSIRYYIPSDVYRAVERNNNISTDQSEMRDANQKSFL